VDTFAPPAPGGLFAAQEGTGVVLRWTASEAPDLAGYLVLRGDGTGETLSQLFKTPIDGTRYVDTAIVPGATYVYAVVAVDRAANRSGESGRQQVTVRAPSE
jgi:fibronectin type 3 domain-containing protein